MQFGEIVAPTIKELFVRRIEEIILSGIVRVGDKLPTEREMAAQMKISKTIIHMGVEEMVRKGFLQVIPRKGILVANYIENGTVETLNSIMQYNGRRLDEQTRESLFEVRLALEGPAVRKVALARSEDTLRALWAIVEAAQKAAEEPPDYAALTAKHFCFHHTILVASGNTITPLILNGFRAPTEVFWEQSILAMGAFESVCRLKCLLGLIEAGDGDGAYAYLELTLRYWRDEAIPKEAGAAQAVRCR